MHSKLTSDAAAPKPLPQAPPALAHLECAGRCVQARAVGGDGLGGGRLGLALADVSKGFSAALLAATLPASLRSLLPHERLDLARQLGAVNRLLYDGSEANRYATLFLGIFNDADRRLLYANCGHTPPILLTADGSVRRLGPTAPVLGLLLEWECETGDLALSTGDLLAVFSHGISEAFSLEGEELGDDGLAEVLGTNRALPLISLGDSVIGAVTQWSGGAQRDDQTLLLVRGR